MEAPGLVPHTNNGLCGRMRLYYKPLEFWSYGTKNLKLRLNVTELIRDQLRQRLSAKVHNKLYLHQDKIDY